MWRTDASHHSAGGQGRHTCRLQHHAGLMQCVGQERKDMDLWRDARTWGDEHPVHVVGRRDLYVPAEDHKTASRASCRTLPLHTLRPMNEAVLLGTP